MERRILGLVASVGVALCALGGLTAVAKSAPVHELTALDQEGARADRADRLRAILQLRPAQESVLQSYLATLEGLNRRMKALAGPVPATMPERVGQMQHIMAEGVGAMDMVADATRRFYAQLDPGQQRALDALPMQAVMHGEKPGLGMAGGVLTGLDPLQAPPPR
jgi:hypothetical protein